MLEMIYPNAFTPPSRIGSRDPLNIAGVFPVGPTIIICFLYGFLAYNCCSKLAMLTCSFIIVIYYEKVELRYMQPFLPFECSS